MCGTCMLLLRYGIRDEGELVTGCVAKFKKVYRRREHDAKQEVHQQVSYLLSSRHCTIVYSV